MAQTTFKPYDRVIVRLTTGKWKADLYSHYDEQSAVHRLVSGERETKDILPFEGNEYLIYKSGDGSVDPDAPREGELIIFANSTSDIEEGYGMLGKLNEISDGVVRIQTHKSAIVPFPSIFFISLAKYDTSDMETTKREIFQASEGKITRLYK